MSAPKLTRGAKTQFDVHWFRNGTLELNVFSTSLSKKGVTLLLNHLKQAGTVNYAPGSHFNWGGGGWTLKTEF